MLTLPACAILLSLASDASFIRVQQSVRSAGPATVKNSRADVVDDVIRGEMRKRHVAGLSLAIIQDGKIVKAKGYGVTEQAGIPR